MPLQKRKHETPSNTFVAISLDIVNLKSHSLFCKCLSDRRTTNPGHRRPWRLLLLVTASTWLVVVAVAGEASGPVLVDSVYNACSFRGVWLSFPLRPSSELFVFESEECWHMGAVLSFSDLGKIFLVIFLPSSGDLSS
jgi:hypothetical protein